MFNVGDLVIFTAPEGQTKYKHHNSIAKITEVLDPGATYEYIVKFADGTFDLPVFEKELTLVFGL